MTPWQFGWRWATYKWDDPFCNGYHTRNPVFLSCMYIYICIPLILSTVYEVSPSYVCCFITPNCRHIYHKGNWGTTLYHYFPLQVAVLPSTGNFDEQCFLEMMAPLGYRAHDSMPLVAPGTWKKGGTILTYFDYDYFPLCHVDSDHYARLNLWMVCKTWARSEFSKKSFALVGNCRGCHWISAPKSCEGHSLCPLGARSVKTGREFGWCTGRRTIGILKAGWALPEVISMPQEVPGLEP